MDVADRLNAKADEVVRLIQSSEGMSKEMFDSALSVILGRGLRVKQMDIAERLHSKAHDCDRAAGGLAISHPDLSVMERLRAIIYRKFAGQVSGLETVFLSGIKDIALSMNFELQRMEDDFETERKKHD